MKNVSAVIGRKQEGVVLVISMIFLVVFVSLGVALANLADMNTQTTYNHLRANRARQNAESGLEIMRYWLNQVEFPADTEPDERIEAITTSLQGVLEDQGVDSMYIYDYDDYMVVCSVYLDTDYKNRFFALLVADDDDTLPLYVYGYHTNDYYRAVRVDNEITSESAPSPIFDYGIASRGPFLIPGNPTILSTNDFSEADIYIESPDDWATALDVSGNTDIHGDISIGNATAEVNFDGHIDIGGEEGDDAVDNHVHIGAGAVEFPVPDTDHFRQYATGQTIDSSTDLDDNLTLDNAIIEAGTDPEFNGNVIVNGVLFIEQPNQVLFKGNIWVNGLIVADGDVEEPGDNALQFDGNYYSEGFPEDAEFDTIRSEMGSSLLAPGFEFYLKGNLHSLEGALAVSSLRIEGNFKDTVVKGTIINYNTSPTLIDGNINITFDRSEVPESIAGFTSGGGNATLQWISSSYTEY